MKRFLLLLLTFNLYAQTGQRQLMLGVMDSPATPIDSNSGGGCTGSSGAWTCTGAATVTITDATAAVILYSVSGGSLACPATGTLYSAPFTSPGTTFTLTAIGCNGTAHSATLTSVYTISGASPIAMIDHKGVQATSAGGTATTATMNCTGANSLGAFVTSYTSGYVTPTVTDSTGSNNTKWSTGGNQTTLFTQGLVKVMFFTVPGASVSGSMTISAVGNYVTIDAFCWSNGNGTASIDSAPTPFGAVTQSSIAPGSFTPGASNTLVVNCLGLLASNGTASTYPSTSYTSMDQTAATGSNALYSSCQYQVQTTATATNPSWDTTGINSIGDMADAIISLKQ